MFRLWLLTALAVLTGCGFTPLHGNPQANGSATAALRQIGVPPIPERLGQLLRIELTNQITPKGQPRTPLYVLEVKVKESKQALAVRKDATATRANLILSANFKLKTGKESESLFTGTVRSVNSYNVLDADFATLSAESDARRRAVRDLATEIRSRLGIFLSRPSHR